MYTLSVTPTSQAPETYSISANIFVPGEPVSLWYHPPDGRDIAIEQWAAAADDGHIALDITLAGLPQGSYSLIAYGAWAKFAAAGAFQVP